MLIVEQIYIRRCSVDGGDSRQVEPPFFCYKRVCIFLTGGDRFIEFETVCYLRYTEGVSINKVLLNSLLSSRKSVGVTCDNQ